MITALVAVCAGSAVVAAPAEAHAPTARAVGSACRLLTRAEIALVLPGTTVAPGHRDGRLCRWEYATPTELAGRLAVTTALLRNASPGLIDDAVRIDEQLGMTTRSLTGLGRRAVYEVEKSNLIVLTKRGNIFEVQILGDVPPDIREQQIVALARLALPRA